MRTLFCWHCKAEVPMLDEEEFARVTRLQNKRDPALMLRAYREITGFVEPDPAAVLHHRIALYGPPCANCGKPLRTPAATFCAACGTAA